MKYYIPYKNGENPVKHVFIMDQFIEFDKNVPKKIWAYLHSIQIQLMNDDISVEFGFDRNNHSEYKKYGIVQENPIEVGDIIDTIKIGLSENPTVDGYYIFLSLYCLYGPVRLYKVYSYEEQQEFKFSIIKNFDVICKYSYWM